MSDEIISLGGEDKYSEVKAKRDQSGVWIHQGTDTVLLREHQWTKLVRTFVAAPSPHPIEGE